jgi:acyl-CoA thioester hydrolase
MTSFEKMVEIRWSDLDPNNHLRHSVYYDFGAYSRISFLYECGLTPERMREYGFGPIIFREECLFKKEIKFGDRIMVNLKLETCRADASRWTMKHELELNGDTLAAIITVDGAWLDTRLRKLTKLPAEFSTAFLSIPKTDGFKYSEQN